MNQTLGRILACIAAVALVDSARAATLATVGVYDEDVVNPDTVDAVSPTTNNSLTLNDVKTLMADAFAADTGGVWDFEPQNGDFGHATNGAVFTLGYGASQGKTLEVTATFAGLGMGPSVGSAISKANNLGLNSGVYDILWVPSKPLTLVAVSVVDRGSSTKLGRLVATLQDNSTIETTDSPSNTDTLHVLTATTSNPIVSFMFDGTGSYVRYDDLAFITAPETALQAGTLIYGK